MKDSKLINLLKSFTEEEIKSFEKFVRSPYFNSVKNHSKLFDELIKFYPGFESSKLTGEYLHKKLFKTKAFNKQVIWNLFSGLEKLAAEFILQLGFKESGLERFMIGFEEHLQRKLDKQNLNIINQFEKKIDTEKIGPDFFYELKILENNKSEYWHTIKGRQDRAYESIVNVTELLFLNFFCEISVQTWDLYILRKMYNPGERTASAFEMIHSLELEKIVKHAEQKKSRYSAVLRFYYNKIMCALYEDEEQYFHEMKSFFEKNSEIFEIKEQRNIIITLANYCANKMRLGKEYYFRVLFDINKMRLEKGQATISNGRINKALYHQILRNALALGEIKWAQNFIEEYTPKLIAEVQHTMKALALGYLHFVKGDYRKALKNINNVDFIDIRDKLHVRILTAKSYYQLEETELLLHYIDSSKHFISSAEAIDGETRNAYTAFFKILEKFILIKAGKDNSPLKALEELIKNDNGLRLRHKNWFIEKINEITDPDKPADNKKLLNVL